MLDMMSFAMKLLTGSVFDVHTYVGIVLGVLFTPFFVAVYKFAKAFLIKKVPASKIAIDEVEGTVEQVKDRLDPIVNKIEDKMENK